MTTERLELSDEQRKSLTTGVDSLPGRHALTDCLRNIVGAVDAGRAAHVTLIYISTAIAVVLTMLIANLRGDVNLLEKRVTALEKTPRTVQITYTPPAKPEPKLQAAFARKSGLKREEFPVLPGLGLVEKAKREVAKR